MVGLIRISGLVCVSSVPVALGALRLSSHVFSHCAPADKHFAKFMHGTEYTHFLMAACGCGAAGQLFCRHAKHNEKVDSVQSTCTLHCMARVSIEC